MVTDSQARYKQQMSSTIFSSLLRLNQDHEVQYYTYTLQAEKYVDINKDHGVYLEAFVSNGCLQMV